MASTTTAPVVMTAQDLLDVMSDNIQRLRAGQLTPAQGNSIVNSVAMVVRLSKAQMDYAKATNATPYIPLLSTKKPTDE